jgi:GDP-mannose 6-dehydrogenase
MREAFMKIAMFGLGYVGVTAAACLAKCGHEVVGIDPNEEKVGMINSGRSPIAEPGLEELVATAVGNGLLKATFNVPGCLDSCDTVIVCVGTPSAQDGSHDMSYIAEVSRQIASAVSPTRSKLLTVVYRSTIRPGTLDELVWPIFEEALGGAVNKVELVYNPEFLRESVAISDYFKPPKIVIGTRDGRSCKNLDIINTNIQAPVFYTGYREAEITKFVDNTFHALKVTFANEIGRLCKQLGVDAQKVHEIFVSDTKLNISPYYLRPGGAFGGSCLPKDVRALQFISSEVGANTPVVDSLLRSNEMHKNFVFDICTKGIKPNAGVLMIGLAFKADSDDLRESPNIDLARKLLQAGFDLSIFDPHVDPARLLGQNLGYANANLPTLHKLLVSQTQIEASAYDLVIDTRGSAKKYRLISQRIIDIHAVK